MCIGVPLQVLTVADGPQAWCVDPQNADAGQGEWLDMSLVGAQPPGTWVLAFQGAARHVMDAESAVQARAGRQALAAAMRGGAGSGAEIDALFADLVGRTPELPPHLRTSSTR